MTTAADITAGDWFSLAGAIGSIVAASIAVIALYKIRDERRRTFRLTVLIDLANALGEPGVDSMFNERVRTLLHMVPADWFPVMRVRLSVNPQPGMQAVHDQTFAGVNQFEREAVAIRTTREEIGERASSLL